MNPQDTDPLRAQGTDREEWHYPRCPSCGLYFNVADGGRRLILHESSHHHPYPGWSVPRPWYRRLVAWVRRG